MLIEIKQNFEEEINTHKTAIIDYWAPWCGPCKMMSALLENISNIHQDIKFCKVNVDENPELAEKHNISSLPTLVLFEYGKELRRITGMRPQTTIEKFIKNEDYKA